MSKFLVLVAMMVVVFCSHAPGLVNAGIMSDIEDGIDAAKAAFEATTCMDKIPKGEIETCNRVTGFLYTANQPNKDKRDCCSYLATRDCIHAAFRIHCGERVAKYAKFAMNLGKDLSLVCLKYDNAIDCMNPLVFWGAVALGVILVVACVKACCCSKRDRVLVTTTTTAQAPANPAFIKTDGQAPLLANEVYPRV